jgi:aminopeptidase N
VDGIHAAREFIRQGLAGELSERLRGTYESFNGGQPYSKSPSAMARRSLKNLCLAYLVEEDGGDGLAVSQLQRSDNMTDTLAALAGLVLSGSAAAPGALSAFEQTWKANALVMDKWFAMQAMKPGPDTVHDVRRLLGHPAFSIRNPNKVRALIGVFCMMNHTGFHCVDGSGYALLADQVIRLNAINPQIAARMASAFNRWRRYDASRQSLMKAALKRIASEPGLSPDVGEIVSNALH